MKRNGPNTKISNSSTSKKSKTEDFADSYDAR